jgi:hypothetical protein
MTYSQGAGGLCWCAERLEVHLRCIDIESRASKQLAGTGGMHVNLHLVQSMWRVVWFATRLLRNEAGLDAYCPGAPKQTDLVQGASGRQAGAPLSARLLLSFEGCCGLLYAGPSHAFSSVVF